MDVGDESVVEVEVANEVDDDDFFDDVLLIEVADFVDTIDGEALLFDKEAIDLDFEVDIGVVLATDANLLGTLDLARVGTNKK